LISVNEEERAPVDGAGTCPTGRSAIAESSAVQRTSGRVLLVEHNSMNQRIEGGMLTRLDFDVDVVTDTTEAAKVATRTRYHAMMVDSPIPLRARVPATGEIYRLKGGSHATPIIGIISRGGERDGQGSVAAGLDASITRPFDLAVLATVLAPWSPQGRGN
jgi:DNA-binding response OmpR family regulator